MNKMYTGSLNNNVICFYYNISTWMKKVVYTFNSQLYTVQYREYYTVNIQLRYSILFIVCK